MKTAYLNCVNKTLKVEIVGENFTLELKGDKVIVGKLRTKQGDYITRFDFSNDLPEFSIVKDSQLAEYLQKGDFNVLLDVREEYRVCHEIGSREDYFGVEFKPNGFISWYETFYYLSVEFMRTDCNSLIENFMSHPSELRRWTDEFEEQFKDEDWSEKNFTDEIDNFVKLKKQQLQNEL